MGKEKKLWAGRFQKPVSRIVEQFTESVSFDRRLYRQDIAGSRAHARMLAACGLLTPQERDSILSGLDRIEKGIETGKFEFRADREDVHTNIEAALIERIGEPGRKLHTARSRNDQVAVDVRLLIREETDEILQRITGLQKALLDLAAAHEDVIVPGYTHLQRAQPLLLPHLLMAYMDQLDRDAGRLRDCRARMNYSPLGACALAGTSLPIDREMTARELGFSGPVTNSVDAVSDRDYMAEFLSCLAILAMHLSRLAEEWVLWASAEFGFVLMDDSVATGSSIMPQKKNPDPMELVRGKTGRICGNLLCLLTLMKGLPLAYNRDLQEDKIPLFDSIDTSKACLEVTAEFARNIRFDRERIRTSLERGYLDATTLAEYLVMKGMPFRSAHEAVGRLVRMADARSAPLAQLTLEELRSVSEHLDTQVFTALGVKNAVKRFCSSGSTGPKSVRKQMKAWRKRLG
jgi:argininosuccinate lyase